MGDPRSLADEVTSALQDLRAAFIGLYSEVGADPTSPQDVSRQFGIHKNLAWKISRVLGGVEPLACLQHLPGDAGLDIVIEAMQRAGARPEAVKDVEKARHQLDDIIVEHAGDRANLELILDSMGLLGNTNRLEVSREHAFRGNSGIWGVQVRCRLTTGILAPSRRSSDQLRISLIGGLVGFRRLRPDVRWTLFRFKQYCDNGTSRDDQTEPLEPPVGDVPRLLRRFCSPNLPAIEHRIVGTDAEYVLAEGPVGNKGQFDCFFGEIGEAPAYANENDKFGEFSSGIRVPVETLMMDLIVHRDVPMGGAPFVVVEGFPTGSPDQPEAMQYRTLLPLGEPMTELAGRPPALMTPLVPRYTEMVSLAYDRLGYEPKEFRAMRLVMKYPPMSSVVAVKWELAKVPTPSRAGTLKPISKS